MFLKVCGNNDLASINHLEQNSNIDFLGFIFYPSSKRNLTIDFPEKKIIPRVGVFVNEKLEIIKNKITKHQLDFVQLHGNENVDFCFKVNEIKPVIKVFLIDSDFNFDATVDFLNCCKYFLFDTKSEKYGGSGEKFDWGHLNKFLLDKPYFISGGISHLDLEEINKLPKNCVAVDINSKFEVDFGKKDYKLIESFSKKIK
jgi:phosphoribosylanthranilate isomerase